MLYRCLSVFAAFGFLVLASEVRAQDTLISNYGQPNQLPNVDLSDLSQRVAWDFTTGADAYSDLFLTVQASNNDGSGHFLNADFYTSATAAPDALVGTLSIRVGFTEGSFQDFSNDAPAAVILNANTTYWVVLSLADPLNNVGPPGIQFRNIADGTTDAGGIYTSLNGTPLLTSSNSGSTWLLANGSDAVKYLLQGTKVIVATPPPDAIATASSLQGISLQSVTSMLEDFALRLFRLRSGQGNNGSDPNSIVVNLGGEDELVVLGEGDGPGSRQVGIRTGRAGQLRIFSTFDYGYGGLSGSLASQRTNTYGGTLGAELNLSDRLAAGFGVGALSAQTRLAGGVSRVNTDGLMLAAYTSYHASHLYADLLYAATMLNHDLRRDNGAGAVTASPDSTVHTVQFNTGWNFAAKEVRHGPFVTLNYAHAGTNPYTEAGPGAVTVGRQYSNTLLGRVGWQASTQIKREWGVIIPQVRLSWDKQYLNDSNNANVALAGVPGLVTRTGTAGARQNGLGVGAGVMLRMNNQWSVAVNYQGHVMDKVASVHSATAFVSYCW